MAGWSSFCTTTPRFSRLESRKTSMNFSSGSSPASSGSSRRRMLCLRSGVSSMLFPQVIGDAGDDDLGLEEQRRLQEEAGLVVQEVVPPALADRLGDDDGDEVVLPPS